jgi:hypothetical protein
MTAQLDTLGPNTRVALKEGTSWGSVILATLRDANADTLPEVKIPVAKKVELSDTEKAALTTLAAQLGAVVWPSDRRKMTTPELRSLLTLLETTKSLKSLVERLEKNEKIVFFNHFDVLAETRKEGVKASPHTTPRHKDGFYAIPDSEGGVVEDLAVKATREVSASSVAISIEKLFDMVAEGRITKATFLRLTKQVRVIDEDAVFAEIRSDHSILPILKDATVITRAGNVSLNLRKNA